MLAMKPLPDLPFSPHSSEEVFRLFSQHMTPGKAEWLSALGLSFAIGHREGVYLWDSEGKRRLLNCHSNGGTFNLGHRHPAVVAALFAGLQHLDIGNHHLPSLPKVRLAQKLAALAPKSLTHAVFATSGGEAVDLALKVARRATQRRKIVSAVGGYHGHTGLAVATGEPKYAHPFLIDTTDFVRIPFDDPAAAREAIDKDTAACILETIPATLGMPVPSPGYLQLVKELCAKQGAAYIADEVQTGLGRTGTLWAVEQHHVTPDILVTAKGLGGGLYPIAATLMTPSLARVFADDPFSHISTFGGADLGCVVAECVLELCSAPAFLERVRTFSQAMREKLEALKDKHQESGFLEVRGTGAMLGLKFSSSMAGPLLSKACLDHGLLCVFCGNDSSVLQFLPPLIISDEQIDEALSGLDAAIGTLRTYGVA